MPELSQSIYQKMGPASRTRKPTQGASVMISIRLCSTHLRTLKGGFCGPKVPYLCFSILNTAFVGPRGAFAATPLRCWKIDLFFILLRVNIHCVLRVDFFSKVRLWTLHRGVKYSRFYDREKGQMTVDVGAKGAWPTIRLMLSRHREEGSTNRGKFAKEECKFL